MNKNIFREFRTQTAQLTRDEVCTLHTELHRAPQMADEAGEEFTAAVDQAFLAHQGGRAATGEL